MTKLKNNIDPTHQNGPMCWLNDYRFKKRGHFSSDLCISRLCIFSMYLILSDRNKNSSLFSIWKCIFGICLFDWYPSEVTHKLQVENLCKTRFRMFFFFLKRKGILENLINTKSKMKHIFSFETTLHLCQNAFENFSSYLWSFFGGH